MRLPKEPLMAERYYQARANKLVENHRSYLEYTMNSTNQEIAFNILGIVLSAVVAYLVFDNFSFFAAVVTFICGLVCTFLFGAIFVKGYPESYGKWRVKCEQTRFHRGSDVFFICERIVDGEVVERVSRG